MQPVRETRRRRLELLIDKHGSIAKLNVALGLEPTNARLSQIRNASKRKERGTNYEMGDATARDIEEKLKLPVGWMDTPIGMEALDDPSASKVLDLLNSMTPEERAQAVRLLMRFKSRSPHPTPGPTRPHHHPRHHYAPTAPRASNDSDFTRLR